VPMPGTRPANPPFPAPKGDPMSDLPVLPAQDAAWLARWRRVNGEPEHEPCLICGEYHPPTEGELCADCLALCRADAGGPVGQGPPPLGL